jgi:hypothetical protein
MSPSPAVMATRRFPMAGSGRSEVDALVIVLTPSVFAEKGGQLPPGDRKAVAVKSLEQYPPARAV